MNKSYTLFKDKAIIIDDSGNKIEIPNQEGLDDILEQENVVEQI